MTMTDVAGFLKISVSTASAAAKRGKKTTLNEHLDLTEILNAEMRRASPLFPIISIISNSRSDTINPIMVK
ncbi:MAG: hypothetical protein KKF30_15300 [Proteobacteria bacterium]|nr:hypothetical protein [Pseudomonadota bacterium]MBU4469695.1 hypothetical protein [Pseudomonadota bacterium]MCG2751778.1 hypothetical protein [Desulfobacteraceae bacterium]